MVRYHTYQVWHTKVGTFLAFRVPTVGTEQDAAEMEAAMRSALELAIRTYAAQATMILDGEPVCARILRDRMGERLAAETRRLCYPARWRRARAWLARKLLG